ncbi:MAG: hypothetical protein AAGI48_16545 [Verrucomicrobiota bacterium]
MVNPKLFTKASLSSRIALASALLLAGGFGLAVTYFVPTNLKVGKMRGGGAKATYVQNSEANPAQAPSRPAPKDLVAFCSEHVSEHRSFVIFQNGTCVVVNEPSADPIGDARQRLLACEDPEARFVPELTQEGNLMISFKEPVFHNFTSEERAQLQVELDRIVPTLLTPKEKASAGGEWTPPVHARFGLLARRRMLEDAADPVPVKVIRAKERVVVQN